MTAVAPTTSLVEQGAVLFNFPVSSDEALAVGGLLNYILSIATPVGTIIDSFLTENSFIAVLGAPSPSTWVLADGRDVTGSAYATLTGNATIPNLQGIMRRGKNNGRADGKQNPAGDLPLGTYSTDIFDSHSHIGLFDQGSNQEWGQTGAGGGSEVRALLQGFPGLIIFPVQEPMTGPSTSFFTGQAGTLDTSPKNVTVNSFIRIN